MYLVLDDYGTCRVKYRVHQKVLIIFVNLKSSMPSKRCFPVTIAIISDECSLV
jgi:hypothetical protein